MFSVHLEHTYLFLTQGKITSITFYYKPGGSNQTNRQGNIRWYFLWKPS